MPVPTTLLEPGRVDEPRAAEEYSNVLTQVASDHRPVIVRRNGADLAAVVPLEHLELLQDLLARQEAERMAAQLDWDRLVKTSFRDGQRTGVYDAVSDEPQRATFRERTDNPRSRSAKLRWARRSSSV